MAPNETIAKAKPHLRPADAVAAFYAEGWREQLAGSLREEFQEPLGYDAIVDAVDGALETALTRLKPEPGSEPPTYSGRMLFALARTIAWRRMRDQLRRNGRWVATVTVADRDMIGRIPDGAPDPEEASINNERAEQVREAAAGLDEQTLLVLSLFHVEGFKKPQIQRLLGLTEHAVRTRLRRGNEYLLQVYLDIEAGTTCEGKFGPLRLAFDLARGREARRTRAHIGHCRECARSYRHALAYRRGVAGIAPAPVLRDPALSGLFERGVDLGREFVGRMSQLPRSLANRFGSDAIPTARSASTAASGGAKLLGLCAGVALATGGALKIANDDQTGRVHSSVQAGPSIEAAAQGVPDRDDHASLARAAARRRTARPVPRRRKRRTATPRPPLPVAELQPSTPQRPTVTTPPWSTPIPSRSAASSPPAQPDEFAAP